MEVLFETIVGFGLLVGAVAVGAALWALVLASPLAAVGVIGFLIVGRFVGRGVIRWVEVN